MKEDEINKKYWSNEEPQKILAGVYFPGEELIKLVNKKSNILDVGCGSGKVSEYLYENNYVVTGIDINKKALDENRKRNPNITYIEADITRRLPFNDSFFGVITVPYVFVSIINKEEAQKAANELVRVLKDGGLLWICEATYSKDYNERYKTGKELTGLDNVALSFFDDGLNKGKIKRVIRHYSNEEIDKLFVPLNKIFTKQFSVVSPSSGMEVQTIVNIYKKV